MTTPDFPDFRALAQELVETWDATADFDFNDFGHAAAEIVDRARIELATPPRELPTDEELNALEKKLWDEYKTIPYQGDEFMYDDDFRYALIDYRAALERWGK